MAERTLRKLDALDMNIQTLCIEYPDLDVQCELKYGSIHLFSKFHGLAVQYPHTLEGISYNMHHHETI